MIQYAYGDELGTGNWYVEETAGHTDRSYDTLEPTLSSALYLPNVSR